MAIDIEHAAVSEPDGQDEAFERIFLAQWPRIHATLTRLVGDADEAEDLALETFWRLYQRPPRDRAAGLGGWLHRHACFVASKTMRSERRRLARERQAVEMNSMEDHSAASLASVTPILDDAINQLGSEDRAAIMLRFFEQNDFASVGAALGSNEEAARKRVNRALDKLEVLLKRRGVALSATALAAAHGAGRRDRACRRRPGPDPGCKRQPDRLPTSHDVQP